MWVLEQKLSLDQFEVMHETNVRRDTLKTFVQNNTSLYGCNMAKRYLIGSLELLCMNRFSLNVFYSVSVVLIMTAKVNTSNSVLVLNALALVRCRFVASGPFPLRGPRNTYVVPPWSASAVYGTQTGLSIDGRCRLSNLSSV